MIVLDSSILVGILRVEADAEALVDLLAAEECVLGTPTLVETRMWCSANARSEALEWVERFIGAPRVSVVPFNRDMADAASRAFSRFGRGSGHRARLNFGDCMAYAVSTVLRAPLLFKGADFAHTDVMAHEASIRS